MATEVRYALHQSWQVAYEVKGQEGPVVVLVHGHGADRTHWHRQLNHGLPRTRLVAIDLLGHGASDAPSVRYSMGLFAGSVAATLDDLAAESAVLVGHSNGVPVVREFYRRFQRRVLGLVALDGPLRRPDLARLELMTRPLRQPDWRPILEQMVQGTPTVAPNLEPEDHELIQRVMLNTPHHVLLGSAEAMLDEAIWDDDQIHVALLVVSSDTPFSELHSDEYRQFVHRLAPQLEFHVWENVSHFLMLEQPRRLVQLLARFLRSLGFTD